MASFFKKLFGGGETPQKSQAPETAPERSVDATSGANVAGMDHSAVLERARNDLALKTAAHDGSWRLGETSWDVDLETGTITFINDRKMKAVVPVQVIGTLDTAQGSWLWGWNHPSVLPARAKDAEAVCAYGEQRGIAELTTRLIPCDETTAWDFTALACLLASAQGGYSGLSGSTLIFMTFGNVTLSQA